MRFLWHVVHQFERLVLLLVMIRLPIVTILCRAIIAGVRIGIAAAHAGPRALIIIIMLQRLFQGI